MLVNDDSMMLRFFPNGNPHIVNITCTYVHNVIERFSDSGDLWSMQEIDVAQSLSASQPVNSLQVFDTKTCRHVNDGTWTHIKRSVEKGKQYFRRTRHRNQHTCIMQIYITVQIKVQP